MQEMRFGDGVVSVQDAALSDHEGRPIFEWRLVLDSGHEFSDQDLKGPAMGPEPSEREMLGTLFGFIGAAVESREYRERSGVGTDCSDTNEWLFPADVVTWAQKHSDEISMAGYEIENPEGVA